MVVGVEVGVVVGEVVVGEVVGLVVGVVFGVVVGVVVGVVAAGDAASATGGGWVGVEAAGVFVGVAAACGGLTSTADCFTSATGGFTSATAGFGGVGLSDDTCARCCDALTPFRPHTDGFCTGAAGAAAAGASRLLSPISRLGLGLLLAPPPCESLESMRRTRILSCDAESADLAAETVGGSVEPSSRGGAVPLTCSLRHAEMQAVGRYAAGTGGRGSQGGPS